LDFCQTLEQTYELIAYRFLDQYRNTAYSYNRCFMFTASLRPHGEESFLKNLNTVLSATGAKVCVDSTWRQEGTLLEHGVRRKHPVLLKRGGLAKYQPITLYSYRDGNPMMTCVIMH
jgi:hypothetical protein